MKFRQKQFTLSEGRYTGPKDLPDVPGALSVIGKTALAGSAIGGLVGGIMKDSTVLEGAEIGGKSGILAGVAAKILLNTLHNPMKKVKFSEVDKNIRARFGMFRASGFVIGDTAERRGKFDEKFVINDREVTNYKINVAIQDDQVRMYTLGLGPDEIKKLDSILDYHCKKYSGMGYTATMIGGKQDGSFSVNITFTNYQVLSGFLMEVSDSLMTKINLLDSKAIVENKIWSPEEKEFSSVPKLSKMDVISILTKSGVKLLGVRSANDLATVLLKGVISIISRMSDTEKAMVSKDPVSKKDLQNRFLEKCLKDSGYLEGPHYTVDAKVAPFNMYMYNGNLIMSIAKDSKEYKIFKKQVIVADGVINVNDLGNACLCTKVFNSRKEVPVFLKKLIGVLGIKPNIYLV